ncbi:MAG: hypothetical protein Q4E39_00870 [bacterium]|nr:hypothetical protein [bacterium]
MISNLDKMILTELDKQRFKAHVISTIMNKLNEDKSKNIFLDYLIENRNVLLSKNDVVKKLREILV